jgi:hypothetical protein
VKEMKLHTINEIKYREDGDITGRSVMVVKEAFINPENKAYEMDLITLTMNHIKTKHMESATRSANTQFLSVIIYDFKKVTKFIYMGTLRRSLLLGSADI